ncbi:oleate hydratase [Leptospira langatensis]|uniref:Oleate hydratase n=1 Tax=Leptospira langatensis TaxID=2484983 RepID=A0A5F1ZRS0_9LEPT|nr:oleate hydratase [Leptospira langatensis]TGK02611.1 oleate hydratase [Leptospira langatensis]TGL40187.1 oleate hydratase [Leptospira langatensis]
MRKKNTERQAYFVGGGIASLAAAVYLIQDAGFEGKNIHIMESLSILGGSNDGSGTESKGFVCRGGRMLNEETYENFWDLMERIPSLEDPSISLKEEIFTFDHANPTHSLARLIDKDGNILSVTDMQFNSEDRSKLVRLFFANENDLDDLTIRDWFGDHFFTTNFWYMWQTTFAWQEWSSLFEFQRYMKRMLLEFSRIDTLEGVTRTPYNQFDSVILPIKTYLDQKGVNYHLDKTVIDLQFLDADEITVTHIHWEDKNGKAGKTGLDKGDLCFFTNGCITDNSNNGSYHTPAKYLPENPPSFLLWRKISDKKPGKLGNPNPFFQKPDETKWFSFTATFKGQFFLRLIEEFTKNRPGSGALMTFKDSSWRMSIVVAAQPHFKTQDKDTTILWGYGLFPDQIGDLVKKRMSDCTGEEVLDELIHHLHFEEHGSKIKSSVINVIPVMLPYIDALFQPRKKSDRPAVVPTGSTNLALISQFVEIPEDMVFTEEYSVRAARLAVYTLLGINKQVAPVTKYWKRPTVLARAVHTSYRS